MSESVESNFIALSQLVQEGPTLFDPAAAVVAGYWIQAALKAQIIENSYQNFSHLTTSNGHDPTGRLLFYPTQKGMIIALSSLELIDRKTADVITLALIDNYEKGIEGDYQDYFAATYLSRMTSDQKYTFLRDIQKIQNAGKSAKRIIKMWSEEKSASESDPIYNIVKNYLSGGDYDFVNYLTGGLIPFMRDWVKESLQSQFEFK